MVSILHLTPSDYQISTWSGGQTTQLFLSPKEGSYPDRTFDFRLSTATVEVEKSDFTDLSGYHRILMPLDASIRLNHLEQEVVLNPFQSYFFDGGDPVSSQGTCQDFNLIYKPSYQGHMSAISPHESVSSQSRYQFIYALSSLTLEWGKEHTKVLQAHELLVLEQASPLQEMTITFSPLQSGEQAIAIWTALK
jgi:probable cytoplasmic protein